MVPQKVIWRSLRIETGRVDIGQPSPLFSHYNKYFLCSHFFIISKNLWSSVYKCFDGSKIFFMINNITSPKNGHWELLALLSKILSFFFFGIISIVINNFDLLCCDQHCVKSVRIRSYSGSHFPAFGLNNSEYEHFSCSVMIKNCVKCNFLVR